MLRIDAINVLEDFFHTKKMITLDAIGRDASDATVDLYIRGFLRSIMERIQDMAPEFKQLSTTPAYAQQPGFTLNSYRATPTNQNYPPPQASVHPL